MRRISKDCNPIIKNGKNLFQDEDSTLDPPVEGTFLNAEWLNSVQEEICNVIEKEFPLEPKKNNQLLEALNTKIKNGINNVLKKELSELRGFIKNELKNISLQTLENKKETETLRSSLNDALVALQSLLDFRDGEIASRLAVEEEKKAEAKRLAEEKEAEEEEAERRERVDRFIDRR